MCVSSVRASIAIAAYVLSTASFSLCACSIRPRSTDQAEASELYISRPQIRSAVHRVLASRLRRLVCVSSTCHLGRWAMPSDGSAAGGARDWLSCRVPICAVFTSRYGDLAATSTRLRGHNHQCSLVRVRALDPALTISVPGAFLVHHRLRVLGSPYPFVVLAPSTLPDRARRFLADAGVEVVAVGRTWASKDAVRRSHPEQH